jgi:hypothetical protein
MLILLGIQLPAFIRQLLTQELPAAPAPEGYSPSSAPGAPATVSSDACLDSSSCSFSPCSSSSCLSWLSLTILSSSKLPDTSLQVLDRRIGYSNLFFRLELIPLDLRVLPTQSIHRHPLFIKNLRVSSTESFRDSSCSCNPESLFSSSITCCRVKTILSSSPLSCPSPL